MDDALAPAHGDAENDAARLPPVEEDEREADEAASAAVDEGYRQEGDVQVLVLDDHRASTARDDSDHGEAVSVNADEGDEEEDMVPAWVRHSFQGVELETALATVRSQHDPAPDPASVIVCDECGKRSAVFACAECAQSLCAVCADAIHIIAVLSTHAITWTQHDDASSRDTAGAASPRSALSDAAPHSPPRGVNSSTTDASPPPQAPDPAAQVEHRAHLPVGAKLFFRADDCGRWARELLHGRVVGCDHGVRGDAGADAAEDDGLRYYYRVLWLRGVEALANGFFRATLRLPRPSWPVEIGLFPSQLGALRAVLTAERLARAALRRERVSGRWREIESNGGDDAFPSVAVLNEILDETDAVLGREFRTRLTQQDDAAFLRGVSAGAWQFDAWMAQIGRADELREEAAAAHELDDELARLAHGRLSRAAELLLLWSPRDRVRLFLLEQRELLLPESVQRERVAAIVAQMLFVYAGFAWQRWRKFVARHRRHELRLRRAAAATLLAGWWRHQLQRQQREKMQRAMALALASPMDALALYRRRQLEAAKLYAFITRQCAERQRRALRRWAAATVDADDSRHARQLAQERTAAAARGAWHASHGIASLPRLPRVYAHRKPDGGVAIEDLQLYRQFRAAHAGPTESSYWVVRQRVLMGAYPAGVPAFRDARRMVSRVDYATCVLLEQVDTFVCLAEPHELERHERQLDASSLAALEMQRKRQQQQHEQRGRKASTATTIKATMTATASIQDAATDEPEAATVCDTPWLFERIVRAKHELLRVELAGAARAAERHAEIAQRDLDDLLALLPVPLDEAALAPEVRAQREALRAKRALAQQNVRKAREALAALRPLRFVEFAIPDDGVPRDLDALEAFLVALEDRLRRQERLYVFSLRGHGRTGFIAALLLGRLYGLTAADALERAQRHHDCQPAMHGADATKLVASPHAAPQVAAVGRLLARANDAIYARVVRENSDAQFVQWRAQRRGQPLDAARDGFLVGDAVDEATQRAQQREADELRRVAKRESAAAKLQWARRRQQRERDAMMQEESEGLRGAV